MASWLRCCTVIALLFGALWLAQAPASAHEEREVTMPDGTGRVPEYRTSGPEILVCKTDRADFIRRISTFPADLRARNLELFDHCQDDGKRDIQEAVDDARAGTRILVLPGRYLEEPSLRAAIGQCATLDAPVAELGHQVLSWEQQVLCPHVQNLIAVIDKRNIQIEGTGASPADVVIDAQYRRLNALRADRADGIYLRNVTVQRTTFNAVYVIATDGFVIDQVVGRWNDEYGFLTFASDHGLYTDCEAYGNGDSGLYPGAAANINAARGHDVERYAIEIRDCRSHHNLLGYSGTAGNSVWVHDNEFFANTAGVAMDSAFPDHPGMPQNHARFERNDIHDNNVDYYGYVRDGTCARPSAQRGYERGVVCPATGVPLGAGILTAGGNYNVFADNWIYGQDYAAFVLFWVPAIIRGDSLGEMFDTSHHNRYFGNHLGVSPAGEQRPNGVDVWWDGQGNGNRWQGADAEPITLPGLSGTATHRLAGDPLKMLKLVECSGYDLLEARVPAGCDWYGATGLGRIEVRAAAILGAVLIIAAVVLLWRRLPREHLAYAGLAAGVFGAIGQAVGIAIEGSPIGAFASLLLAAWWLSTGWLLVRDGHFKALAWTTLTLGGLAALQAVDQGLVMLPYIPLPFSWPILLIGVVWVVWVLADPTRRPTPTATDEGAVEPNLSSESVIHSP